jgi:hypothetical protein
MKVLRLPRADRYRVRGWNTRRCQPREETQQMEYIVFDAHKHYPSPRWRGRTGGWSANNAWPMSGERSSSF